MKQRGLTEADVSAALQTYTPTGFAGEAITGDWMLKVVDAANSDTGTINSWTLAFTTTGATVIVSTEENVRERYPRLEVEI